MARRSRSNRVKRDVDAFLQMPYQQIRNPYAPTEVLDPDQLDRIHDASMRILEDVGLKVTDARARRIFREAGFDVDDSEEMVRLDRNGVVELISKAPSSITFRGRDPEKRIRIGEGDMAFVAVGGPAFASDLDRGRRLGTQADLEDFIKITQMLNVIHIEGGCSIAANDLPVDIRHLEFYLACCRYLDKPWKPLLVGTDQARDAIEMACLLHSANREELAANPVFFCNTSINSPLLLDGQISDGIIEMAEAGQALCVTSFSLAGAMAPATVAGALALQNAEVLAMGAFVQAIRPGCPYVYGSFTCTVDMRTGSPSFGTPEFAKAAQASGQLARRYGLPWRSTNATSSCIVDAQAAYESEMSLWGAITGHVGIVNQGAGWLEGGLVASFEKLILDAEMLQMMAAWMEPIDTSEDAFGLDAIAEVGPGGHFFGAAHTLARYENAFYKPIVSDWNNFEMWRDSGSKDAVLRANGIWKKLLAQYQAPYLDPGIEEALVDYVARRSEALLK